MQRRQLFEDRGIGAVGAGLTLLAARQAQLFEQHVAQLLGRADVEIVADRAVNRCLDLGDALPEIFRQLGERFAVDLDPFPLHRRDDRDQRPLDRLVERGHLVAHQPRLEQHVQPQRRVGPFGGEIARPIGRHLGKGDQALAGADQLLERGQFVLERAPHQALDAVIELPAVEHVGHQHRAVVGRQRDAQRDSRCAMAFTSWPIFRTPGSSSSGRKRSDCRFERKLGWLRQDRAPPPGDARAGHRRPGPARGRARSRPAPAACRRPRSRPARSRPTRPLRGFDPMVETFERIDQRVGMRRGKGRHLRDRRLGALPGSHRRRSGQPLRHPRRRARGTPSRRRNGQQLSRVERLDRERRQRARQRRVVVELDQLLRQPRLGLVVDQRLAPLRLLDLGSVGEQGFEIAVGIDQLGRGLDADARDAGNVVDAVAAQRLDLDDLVRADAEFLAHLGLADRPIPVIGSSMRHPVADQLHQILVGGDDGDLRPRLRRHGAHRWRSDRRPRNSPARFGRHRRLRRLAAPAGIAGRGRAASRGGSPYIDRRVRLRNELPE